MNYLQEFIKTRKLLNIFKATALQFTVNIRNNQPTAQRVGLPADPRFGAVFERVVRRSVRRRPALRRAGPSRAVAGTMESPPVQTMPTVSRSGI